VQVLGLAGLSADTPDPTTGGLAQDWDMPLIPSVVELRDARGRRACVG